MVTPGMRAFIDESSANRDKGHQVYLVCAALVRDDACAGIRSELRSLLLPGQVKWHWTDESARRRREIVARLVELEPMTVIVSHLDSRRRKLERYRRKSLELLYHELIGLDVFDLTLECRSDSQDSSDRAHAVALHGQGLDRRLRLQHRRGGDEPLLWIADAVLGAINAAHLGESRYLDDLRSTVLIEARTPDSLEL